MKLFQVICVFLGASFAIATGLKNGYGQMFIGLVFAYAMTRLVLWVGDRHSRTKKRNEGALRDWQP